LVVRSGTCYSSAVNQTACFRWRSKEEASLLSAAVKFTCDKCGARSLKVWVWLTKVKLSAWEAGWLQRRCPPSSPPESSTNSEKSSMTTSRMSGSTPTTTRRASVENKLVTLCRCKLRHQRAPSWQKTTTLTAKNTNCQRNWDREPPTLCLKRSWRAEWSTRQIRLLYFCWLRWVLETTFRRSNSAESPSRASSSWDIWKHSSMWLSRSKSVKMTCSNLTPTKKKMKQALKRRGLRRTRSPSKRKLMPNSPKRSFLLASVLASPTSRERQNDFTLIN